MALSLDSTVGTLLDDPKAKTVVDRYFPGVSTDPMVGHLKGLTLNMLLSMPQAAQLGLTKERVEEMLVELNNRI